jgi:hypothetical protein
MAKNPRKGTIKMVADKLSNAVAESECEAHRKSQGREIAEIKAMLSNIYIAINGDPGDTRKPGLAGGFIRISDKQDTTNQSLSEIRAKIAVIEAHDILGTVKRLESDQDEIWDRIRADRREARRAAKQFPWLKVVLAMLAICTASMTLAGAVTVSLIANDKAAIVSK